jgi:NAD(P)-dependent dehydrogenase (short-subunit alcohol dehydrogenase family)
MSKQSEIPALTGKKVIVLGGSSGIGLATAKAAAAEGAQVSIVSGNRQRIDKALAVLPANASGEVADLGDEAAIKQFFAEAGSFDHLVYTAGENIQLSDISETDTAAARNFFNVRYWGALATVKYAASHILPGGSINLIGGIASPRPGKGWGIAASICAAMEGFTRAMAIELAPIRVNLVAPGVVRTNLWNSLSEQDREQLYTSVGSKLPVKRVGEAEDIALTYIYLMKQQFATGQVLVVDGGAVLV